MENDALFLIHDPNALYTCKMIADVIERAEAQGHPVKRGSYLEHMTVAQLDRLKRTMYDA